MGLYKNMKIRKDEKNKADKYKHRSPHFPTRAFEDKRQGMIDKQHEDEMIEATNDYILIKIGRNKTGMILVTLPDTKLDIRILNDTDEDIEITQPNSFLVSLDRDNLK